MEVEFDVGVENVASESSNPEALEFYWKGHAALSKLNWATRSYLGPEALRNLENANHLAPDNPRTLASLGWYNFLNVYLGYNLAPGGTVAASPALAAKSMAIEKNALAMMLQAAILFDVDKKDDEALALGNKALEMAPSEILSVEYFGSMLLRSGRLREAREVLENARRIDPHGLIGRPGLGLGLVYLLGGQPEKAEPLLRRQSSVDSNHPPIERVYLIAALAAQGKDEEAEASRKEYIKQCTPDDSGGTWTRNPVGAWCNAFSVRNLLVFTLGFRDPKTLEPLFEGLRKAGFPEEPT